MNSLRSRLVLGFALVAIVPLAIAMVVLSRQIQTTVRNQASDRLGSALGVIEARLRADGERALEKLQILARDATLRRLVLVQPVNARELSEYLAEKRFLLGLDVLRVADSSGATIVDAAMAPSALGRSDHETVHPETFSRSKSPGLELHRVEGSAALAMMASAPIRYQNDVAATLRGGIVLDSALLANLERASGLDLVLRDGDGRIVVSTLGDGEGLIVASPLSDPAAAGPAGPRDGAVSIPGRGSCLVRTVGLGVDPRIRLTGLVSTAAADQAILALRISALVFGSFGLAVAIALGVAWSLQVSRPIERLASFSERLAQGRWEEPLALRGVRELETLGAAIDKMRTDLRTYRERLVAGERHAAWSLMARAVAHEVRNPLTPIAVSIADLKRSYEQGRPEFSAVLDQAARTIGDEIDSLKRMLNEFSELGSFSEPRFAACRLADVIADLETLYCGDVADGRLAFSSPSTEVVVRGDRGQLRQALVNLIKNGLEAVDQGGRVDFGARADGREVEITVADTGAGITDEQRARLFEPHFTTKPHGSGLGLTIVHRIVNDHGGTIGVDSAAGRGTTFRVRLPLFRRSEEV